MNNNHTPKAETGDYSLWHAVDICKMVEPIICKHGFHVALTGGTLYGEGGRKDIDLVFYRIRQVPNPTVEAMDKELEDQCAMVLQSDHGFVRKYLIGGVIPLDVMLPEAWVGDYPLHHLLVDEKAET